MKIFALFAMLSCFGLPSTFAFEISGHELLKQLKHYYIERGITKEELLSAGRGYGYVSGVYDSLREKYNIPNDVKPTHIIAIVYKFLKENPNLRYKRASSLVHQAITEAYPKEKKEEEREKDD